MSEGGNYEWERNELIPAAVKYAKKKAGPREKAGKNERTGRSYTRGGGYVGAAGSHSSVSWAAAWNRLFHRRMNELARKAGLTR